MLSADRLSLSVTGRFSAHAPGDERDLAWRAAMAFFSHAGIRPEVAIRVKKRIPAGAGLGGGSSDAAAVIRALDRLFATDIPEAELRAIGLPPGADVPMCGPRPARGIGEDIRPLGSGRLPLCRLAGGGRDSRGILPPSSARQSCPRAARLDTPHKAAEFLLACRNDLEAPALALTSVIGEVLQALRATEGCLLARMSGSGSACFAVYASVGEATDAAATIARARPAWWSVVTSAW